MIGEWKQEKEWANKSINKWKRHPWFGKTNPWFGTTNPGFGTTDPGFGTTNPGFGTTNPGFGTTNHGFIARNFGCDIWMDEMKVFTVIYGWMRGRCSLWYMVGWEEGVYKWSLIFRKGQAWMGKVTTLIYFPKYQATFQDLKVQFLVNLHPKMTTPNSQRYP